MKNQIKTWIPKLCTACIALGGFLYSPALSLFFFGETEYPTKPEE